MGGADALRIAKTLANGSAKTRTMIRMETDRVSELLARAVAARVTPAAAVGVVTGEAIVAIAYGGAADVTTGQPLTPAHRFDLASLTKTLVTLPEILDLLAAGSADLAAPLADFWPRAQRRPVGALTLAELLSYRGGLPASPPYYLERHGEQAVFDAYLATVPEQRDPAVAVYSDVCFAIAGRLVTDLTGCSLAELAQRRTGLVFTPVPGPAVATERCPWRQRLIVGEVHDENASAAGGVSGHAGAFGTAVEVAGAVQRWLQAVLAGGLAEATTRQWSIGGAGERFGLGWWLPPTWAVAGSHSGPGSFGASGFVGNRIWVEPCRGYGVVVLTNRIHPVRTVDRARFDSWVGCLLDNIAGLT